MSVAKKKGSWGGKRTGAGRPGEHRIIVCTRIRPLFHRRLLITAKIQNLAVSRLLEQVIEERFAYPPEEGPPG
jgi:hypothetical protein